jgi:hypothetical protein
MIHPAYLAGLIDGEGYIGITRHRNKTGQRGAFHLCQLKISNNCKEILDELKAQFGGSISLNSNRPRHIRCLRENWQYMVTARQCLEFLRAIRPFLRIKAAQADLAIEFAGRFKLGQRALTDKEWQIRESYRIRMQALNSRYNGHSGQIRDRPRIDRVHDALRDGDLFESSRSIGASASEETNS